MSSVPEQNNPYAPPQAQVQDVPPTEEGTVLASRWMRLWGAVIDVIFILLAMWVASLITPWNIWDPSKADMTRFALVDAILGYGLFLAVQAYPLYKDSQTWGKKLLGMRIVRADGSPASFGRLIGLRYGVPCLFNVIPAVAQVWGLLDALFIFRESRRCLHDNIADTIVIKT